MTWPDTTAWVVMVVAGIGTFAVRASFLVVAHRLTELPRDVRIALRMVPAATLSALALPALLRPDGPWAPLGPQALAGVVAGLVAWWTRSALATVVVGLLALVALQAVLS